MKRICGLLCAAIVGLSGIVVNVPENTNAAADNLDLQNLQTSGTCGDNVFWSFDESTGTLNIEGTGPMFELLCGPSEVPWNNLGEAVKHIKISEGVTSICDTACLYADLDSILGDIVIPKSVVKIGQSSFSSSKPQYEGLKKLIKEDEPLILGSVLVDGSHLKGNIVIPEGVVTIGWSAFKDAEITSVTLPESLVYIEPNAFSNTLITDIEIPAGVERIGGWAFGGCENLKNASIPESVKYIEQAAFAGTPWCEEKIGDNPLLIINDILLNGTTCKGDVVIPDTVRVIDDSAFGSNKDITSVKLPKNLEEIGKNAFFNCTGLKEISLPDSVVKIDNFAFQGCTALEKIDFPAGLTDIGEQIVGSLWGDSYDTVWVKNQRETNPIVTVNNTVIDGRNYSGNVIIPEGVDCIGQCAFYNNRNITGITFPKSLKTIKNFAFCYCSHTESINNGTEWVTIGLGEVTIPDGVTYIGRGAFINSGLTKITIPASVTAMGMDALGAWNQNRNLTVCGYTGSFAEKYAKAYQLEFESIGTMPETPQLEPTLRGDLDLSNVVDVADAVILARYLVGDDSFAVSDQGLANADADGSGKLTTEDVTYIIKMIVGLI